MCLLNSNETMQLSGNCFEFEFLPNVGVVNQSVDSKAAICSSEIVYDVYIKPQKNEREYCPECGWLPLHILLSSHINSRDHAVVFEDHCDTLNLSSDPDALIRDDNGCTSPVDSLQPDTFMSVFPEFCSYDLVHAWGTYSCVFKAIDRFSTLKVVVKLLDCRLSSVSEALREFNLMRAFGYIFMES